MKTNDAGEQVGVPIGDTLKQRGNRYGKFFNHAELSQELKSSFNDHVIRWGNPQAFTKSMHESIDMIMHKLARIANGDPTYDDNWRDIAGYAQLIVDELNNHDR